MNVEVVLPRFGKVHRKNTFNRWLKNVGERVELDEPLYEVSTAKAVIEVPSPAAGILTEVRFKKGDTLEQDVVVALIDAVRTDKRSAV